MAEEESASLNLALVKPEEPDVRRYQYIKKSLASIRRMKRSAAGDQRVHWRCKFMWHAQVRNIKTGKIDYLNIGKDELSALKETSQSPDLDDEAFAKQWAVEEFLSRHPDMSVEDIEVISVREGQDWFPGDAGVGYGW